jgi:hypothetical protein
MPTSDYEAMTNRTLEMDEPTHRPTEEQRIFAWRVEVLVAAGYPNALAQLVAGTGADLHDAERLVANGCPPALAVRILT